MKLIIPHPRRIGKTGRNLFFIVGLLPVIRRSAGYFGYIKIYVRYLSFL